MTLIIAIRCNEGVAVVGDGKGVISASNPQGPSDLIKVERTTGGVCVGLLNDVGQGLNILRSGGISASSKPARECAQCFSDIVEKNAAQYRPMVAIFVDQSVILSATTKDVAPLSGASISGCYAPRDESPTYCIRGITKDIAEWFFAQHYRKDRTLFELVTLAIAAQRATEQARKDVVGGSVRVVASYADTRSWGDLQTRDAESEAGSFLQRLIL